MIPINMFPLFIDFHYHNLVHDPISIDMSAFLFNFTHMAVDDAPVIYMRLPMVSDWAYKFDYNFKWLGIPFGGEMKVKAGAVDALTTFTLKSTDKGQLYPQLHDIMVDFGDSELRTRGAHLGFVYKQCFNIVKYITMNAINLFGRDMINKMLPYYAEDYLQNQIY
jgi:hypothetical protein